MLKIIYERDPYYSNIGGLNEPNTIKMEMTFDEESSSVEIIAQMIKLLEFMGYTKQTKSMWLEFVNDLTWDGYLIDDTKEEESQEN